MTHRIAIIQGHPDRSQAHLGHALAHAYADAAIAAGHQVRHVVVAELACEPLTRKAAWEREPADECVQAAQGTIAWADHLLIVFPLWLGTTPAAFQCFLEQVLRPGFAFERRGQGWRQMLGGRTAHVVVTMSRPVRWFRGIQGAHGVRGLVRDILNFCGISPVRVSYVGGVDTAFDYDRCLGRMRRAAVRAR